jgi:uncharacterized membrane protein YtjA (UPF0391 family)
MSKSSSNSSSGMGLASVLFVVFLVLKLTGNIDWSWWWVTTPLWGGIALVILVILIIFLISLKR